MPETKSPDYGLYEVLFEDMDGTTQTIKMVKRLSDNMWSTDAETWFQDRKDALAHILVCGLFGDAFAGNAFAAREESQ